MAEGALHDDLRRDSTWVELLGLFLFGSHGPLRFAHGLDFGAHHALVLKGAVALARDDLHGDLSTERERERERESE